VFTFTTGENATNPNWIHGQRMGASPEGCVIISKRPKKELEDALPFGTMFLRGVVSNGGGIRFHIEKP